MKEEGGRKEIEKRREMEVRMKEDVNKKWEREVRGRGRGPG